MFTFYRSSRGQRHLILFIVALLRSHIPRCMRFNIRNSEIFNDTRLLDGWEEIMNYKFHANKGSQHTTRTFRTANRSSEINKTKTLHFYLDNAVSSNSWCALRKVNEKNNKEKTSKYRKVWNKSSHSYTRNDTTEQNIWQTALPRQTLYYITFYIFSKFLHHCAAFFTSKRNNTKYIMYWKNLCDENLSTWHGFDTPLH